MNTPKSFKNLLTLLEYFSDEQKCRNYLEEIRWDGKLKCAYVDCQHDKVLLASKVGISLTEFENKLNPDHPAQFNKIERGILQSTLIELRSDLEDVQEIDWNTAMKIIAKKKVNG